MEGTLCVVGGDSFLGSSLVSLLLASGYSVHATLLPLPTPFKEDDLQYLLHLPGAQDKLKLFHADLRDEGSFDSPVSGCKGVFLLASPIIIASKDPQKEVVDVAINGTINVLNSCVKAQTVKRVVFCSSICAMSALDDHGHVNNFREPESRWSPVDFYRSNTQQFPIWTLAEEAALKFRREQSIEVVSIGPSVVGGPFITPFIPASIHTLLSFFRENNEYFTIAIKSIAAAFGGVPVVHINDVSNAHMFLMEQPAAQGRYLCSALLLSVKEMVDFLSRRYPEMKITDKVEEVASHSTETADYRSEKLRELGFYFKNNLEDIFDDTIKSYGTKMGSFT